MPDEIKKEVLENEQKMIDDLKVKEVTKQLVSILWLYMSCELLYSLPIEPFSNL